MATWAYPQLPPDQLKKEEDASLVNSKPSLPIYLSFSLPMLTLRVLVGPRVEMGPGLSARIFGLIAGRSSGVCGAFSTFTTRLYACSIFVAVRKCERVCNEGRD